MSNERWIDGNALLAHLDNDAKCDTIGMGCLNKSERDYVIRMIRNAPTLQPAGDAISRDAAKEYLRTRGWISMAETLNQIPSLPVAAPDVDVITAEEVVEGIEWHDGQMCPMVIAVNKHSASVVNSDRRGMDSQWFSKKAVAAMLNAAESVTYPKGHPRNSTKPKEPTLLEAAEKVIAKVPYPKEFHEIVKELKAAIDREKGKEETK